MAADDTVISVHETQEGFDEVNLFLDQFYDETGLQVNFSKLVIMKVGVWKDTAETLVSTRDFVWLQPNDCVTYLGIDFSSDNTNKPAIMIYLMHHCKLVEWLTISIPLHYRKNITFKNTFLHILCINPISIQPLWTRLSNT